MKIRDICNSVTDGSHNPPQGIDKSEYMMLSSKNVFDDEITFEEPRYLTEEDFEREHKRTKVSVGDVLLTIVGTVGRTAVVDEDMPSFVLQRSVAVLHPKKDVCSARFLMYALRGKRSYIENRAKGVAQKGIYLGEVSDIDIEIPEVHEQNSIVEKLDKINNVIKQRRQELQLLDDLIKARFVELFGDPMVNPKGYAIKAYGDLFELNAGGTPSKAKPEYWEDGTISWIGSNLCQNVILYENDGKYISQEGYDHSSARLFPIDTVLIALVGATIGKTALLKFETSTNQNVLGVRNIVESGYNPMFVYYYTQFLYQKFMSIGDGGFNMASKGFVSELPMYDVDLTVQNEFAAFAEQVDKSKVAVQKALKETQLLFDSLMQEYFG